MSERTKLIELFKEALVLLEDRCETCTCPEEEPATSGDIKWDVPQQPGRFVGAIEVAPNTIGTVVEVINEAGEILYAKRVRKNTKVTKAFSTHFVPGAILVRKGETLTIKIMSTTNSTDVDSVKIKPFMVT